MIDVGALITKQLTAQADRKDHGGLTVSDIANGCARAKWHELHTGLRKAFDGTTRKKFEYGYALEKVVQNAMEAGGYEVLAPMVVIFRKGSADEIEMAPAAFYDEDPSKWATPLDIVGHPDIVARKKPVDHDTPTLLIEVKSTMLFRNGAGAPAHPSIDGLRLKSGNYILQAAAYAKGVGAKRFGVYVSDRGTGVDATYWFDTDAEFPAFEERKRLMIPALYPDVEPEPTIPSWSRSARGTSYLCKGCPVLSCANNITT